MLLGRRQLYIFIPFKVKSDPIQIERNLWKVIEQISSLFADLSGNAETQILETFLII